jgi:hypothetical protein
MSAIPQPSVNLCEKPTPDLLADLLADPKVVADLELASGPATLKRFNAWTRLAKLGLLDVLPEREPEPKLAQPVAYVHKPGLGFVPGPGGGSGNPFRQTQTQQSSPTVLTTECLRDVKTKEYPWLWPGRIPAGDLSAIMGPVGHGKSTLLAMIAAMVTRGFRFPDESRDSPPRKPGSVLIVQGEESLSSIYRPRAERFGADVARIHSVRGVNSGNVLYPFNLAAHLVQFERWLDVVKDLRLVVIDPIAHFLGGVDSNGDVGVRTTLSQYIRLAQDRNIAILYIMHLNKDEEKDVLNRGTGSGAFVQMPRMVWYLSANPEKSNSRVLSLVKGNPEDRITTGLAFERADGVLRWQKKPVEMSAQEVVDMLSENRRLLNLAYAKAKSGRVATESPRAREFILGLLADGPKPLADVRQAALDKGGLKVQTFNQALKALVAPGDDGTPAPVEKVPLKGRRFELRLRAVARPTGTALIRSIDLLRWSLPPLGAIPPR